MRAFHVGMGLAVATACVVARPARATEHAHARLRYEAPEACPNESAVRQEVLARLGYDPFDDGAPRLVSAIIRRTESGFVATVTLREADGVVRAREPLVSRGARCDELASSVMLAVSIAIDPMSITRPREQPSAMSPPESRPAEAPTAEVSSTPAPPPVDQAAAGGGAERVPIEGSLGAAGRGSLGLLPSAAFGLEAGAGVERRALGVRFGASYDFPASTEGPTRGSVRASLALGSVGVCLRRAPLHVCGLGAVGALFGESQGIARPSADRTFYASAGARVGIVVPMSRSLSARLELEGALPLLPTSLDVDGREAWKTPAIHGGLTLGVLARVF